MSKKVAVILSGCGFKDGAEIHESVLTLLHLTKAGAVPLFFAPNINQTQVTNHLTGENTSEKRNVLVESARIARGQIEDVARLDASKADALIIPGGFGAALNLCDFAIKGADCTVNADVERVIKSFFAAKKPIGFICIAPALAAKVLGNVKLTIGSDAGTAGALKTLGATHENTAVDQITVDDVNRVVSTSAYMCAANIAEADSGISKLVAQVLKMA